MVKHVTLVLLFVMEVCTLGCEQSTALTRAKAKDIIENSSAFKEPGSCSLRFSGAGPQNCTATKELLLGAEEGYWVIEREREHGDIPYVTDPLVGKPTDKGTKYFRGYAFCSEAGDEKGWMITMMYHKRHITNITGITGDDRNKTVELEWAPDMNELPSDLRQLFPEHPTYESHVNLTLYDDGWRVAN